MKVTIACIAAALLANISVCYSQGGYVPGQPSIDCTKVHNPLCARSQPRRVGLEASRSRQP